MGTKKLSSAQWALLKEEVTLRVVFACHKTLRSYFGYSVPKEEGEHVRKVILQALEDAKRFV